MAENVSPNAPRHLSYLDSARGLAAIMVMVYHFINFKYVNTTTAKFAATVFNGSDAVSLFFVLSGFVLSYKYIVLHQPLDIKRFYVTRFFRLWPAFFVTIVLNAINTNRNNPDLHTFIDIFIKNKTSFWEEAILIRNRVNYYGAGWTLNLELALSFFIPFWVVLAKKNTKVIGWLLIAYLLIGNNMRDLYMFHFHFGLGVLISCLFTNITAPSFKEAKWYKNRYLLLLVAFLLFSIRHIDRIWPLPGKYQYLAGYFGIDLFHYTAVASFVFIVAIIQSPKAQKVLEHGILRFFGKISFGIYLMHWAAVVDVFDYWAQANSVFGHRWVALLVLFVIYAAITFGLATVLHYAVELPFIKLGKRIASRLKPSYDFNS